MLILEMMRKHKEKASSTLYRSSLAFPRGESSHTGKDN